MVIPIVPKPIAATLEPVLTQLAMFHPNPFPLSSGGLWGASYPDEGERDRVVAEALPFRLQRDPLVLDHPLVEGAERETRAERRRDVLAQQVDVRLDRQRLARYRRRRSA